MHAHIFFFFFLKSDIKNRGPRNKRRKDYLKTLGCISHSKPNMRHGLFVDISMWATSYWGKKIRVKASLLCTFSLSNQSLQILYLPEGFELGLHYEVILAELTAACVWAFDPLVEAGLVDEAQGACAAAGRDEGALLIPFAVTDPGEGHSSQDEISQRILPPSLIPGCVRNCNLRLGTHELFTLSWC